jgi:hypothetical protein
VEEAGSVTERKRNSRWAMSGGNKETGGGVGEEGERDRRVGEEDGGDIEGEVAEQI